MLHSITYSLIGTYLHAHHFPKFFVFLNICICKFPNFSGMLLKKSLHIKERILALNLFNNILDQSAITCSKLAIETLEQCVKYV